MRNFISLLAPAEYLADKKVVDGLNEMAAGRIDTSTELMQLLEKTDLLYTDCWPRTAIWRRKSLYASDSSHIR